MISGLPQRARVQNLLFEHGLPHSKEKGSLNRSKSSRYGVLQGVTGEKGLLASLSNQSLNQFAENVSKAEALSAEIASIHGGLRGIAASSSESDLSQSTVGAVRGKAGMA